MNLWLLKPQNFTEIDDECFMNCAAPSCRGMLFEELCGHL